MDESRQHFFVYGTLKPGYRGFRQFCQAHNPQIFTAQTSGRIYHLPQAGYPAMTTEPGQVRGVLLIFDNIPGLIATLDDYEGYDPQASGVDNHYQRIWQPVWSLSGTNLGGAWLYIMSREQVAQQQGEWLTQGEWPSCLTEY